MKDLAEFLLARIAEDEAAARAVPDQRWYAVDGTLGGDPQGMQIFDWIGYDEAAHAARWDPARVLAECQAKRRIVDLHKPYRRIYGVGCETCLQPRRLDSLADGWPCESLRLLALPYADHPAYREEWKP